MQTQGEVFRPRRAGAFFAVFGGGEFARCGVRGKCCRAEAGVCKRGYRTPGLASRFPIPPLATPLDLPVCRRLGLASRVFPRITVRGSGYRLERYSLFFFRAIKNRTDFCPCGEIFRQTPFELKSCTPPFPRRWRAGYSASTRAARLSARCTAVQECRACR